MTALPKSKPIAEIPFSDADFREIAQLAKAHFGLHLELSKKALIQSRLTRRLRALGLSDFATYARALKDAAGEEQDKFVSALTTNVTHFYREPHHFEYFETQILPGLVSRARAGARVRLWSAGCSTGQEAFSLSSLVRQVLHSHETVDLRILATDVDDLVLAKAEAAEYLSDECNFPSEDLRARVFGSSALADQRGSVLPEVRDLVTFRKLNLVGPWPISGAFDAIMCRNVAIYFDKATQARLWSRLAGQLVEGGTLFIGHSERIHGPAEQMLENVGITTYRLNSQSNKSGR